MKVYLLCPVRQATEDERAFLDEHVASLERHGVTVHYPPRDAPQDDPIGTEIVATHLKAIRECDEVQLLWNPSSTGSHFDLGAAMVLDKPLRWLKAPERTAHKSYANVILAKGSQA